MGLGSLWWLNLLTTGSNLAALPAVRTLWAAGDHAAAAAVAVAGLASAAFHAVETSGNYIDHSLPGLLPCAPVSLRAQRALLKLDELAAAAAVLLMIRAGYHRRLCAHARLAICALMCLGSEAVGHPVVYALWHAAWHVSAFSLAAALGRDRATASGPLSRTRRTGARQCRAPTEHSVELSPQQVWAR
jgi:hypothetical protein